MLIFSATLVGAFVLMSLFSDNNADDDDDFGGGMMTPVYNPS